ncbi:hypothetical protein MKX01_008373 [Papaver californicum]|nr:hypothetical protein MKX01_008373 [Papaver californicum]
MSEEDITVVESMVVESQASNKRKRNMASKVWKDFELLEDKDGNQKAKCNHCEQEYAYDSKKGGTSTLSRHIKKCPKLETQDVAQLLLSTKNGEVSTRARKIDQTKFREFVAALIICKDLPFNFVE